MGTTESLAAQVALWLRPEVRALAAYHVPDAAGFIKLDAMENPYGLPPDLIDQWLDTLRGVALNRYPDPAAPLLRAALRERLELSPEMELLLGNGSDELIQIILMALAAPGRNVLVPEPGFSMYRLICATVGLNFIGVPLRADFSLDGPAMQAAIALHRPAVVFLCYPNNPTGNLWARTDIDAVIAAAPGLVVVDEAYHAFAQESYLPQLGHQPNLLVLRTLSKMGIAGLRLGMLAGPPAWLSEFDKIRLPYNINVLTQASVNFALRHYAVLEAQAALIRVAREQLYADLMALPGVTPYPSRANFILFRGPAGQAAAIYSGLKARGILIKSMDPVGAGAGNPLRDCLRVTVGTPQENAAFLSALRAVLMMDLG